MPRVFIDSTAIEIAVPAREAATADGHEVEMVAAASDLDGLLAGPQDEEIALVLTGPLEGREARRMIGLVSTRIPRPPIIAIAAGEPEERRRISAELELDECLGTPFEPAELQVVLQQQIERYRLQLATGIVGRTEAIREVLERIDLIAAVNSTVLITGESGTGKELVARAIHRLSSRRGRSFIAVNCAAIPESLLESELFGHEKGSFTGATSRRKGMFELADTGTLLLDEIAEMPLGLQTRLLRVLESHRFMRVGGDTEIEVNVRVIAATNRDLRRAVQQGVFRRDLYYRLNVLHIELPPLRERVPDIPILVRRFIGEFTEAHDREFKGLAPEAMEILLRYGWPGNVRELRNLVESMVVLAPGSVIRAEDIPPEIRSGSGQALLHVPSPPPLTAAAEGEPTAHLPQIEFIFRTLVELKIDLEDLKAEFERFRQRHPELLTDGAVVRAAGEPIEISSVADGGEAGAEAAEAEERVELRLPAGMTMAELERAAIVATLREVGGNRRKAAERLQIGERTLYRKLKEYRIDA
ncbi:MAG: sigma 54-interacting transcriptional regulator [Gemmatimonadota bacterium]